MNFQALNGRFITIGVTYFKTSGDIEVMRRAVAHDKRLSNEAIAWMTAIYDSFELLTHRYGTHFHTVFYGPEYDAILLELAKAGYFQSLGQFKDAGRVAITLE